MPAWRSARIPTRWVCRRATRLVENLYVARTSVQPPTSGTIHESSGEVALEMETTVNLDCVRPERVAGYGTNYVGEGWVERVKGSPIREHKLRATVPLNDDVARKAVDWMV